MDKGEAPPGNAGVSPATFFLAGGGGASAQRCRQAATPPACTALASPNEGQGPVTVPSLRRSRPTLCQANVRASRPQPYSWLEVAERRRNVAARQPPCPRELRWPVRIKGKAPHASRQITPPREGEWTRAKPHPGTRASRPQPFSSLEVAERQPNVAGRQPPRQRVRHWPVRMKGKAPLPFHPCGGVGQGCAA